jgi:hypothetical protein
MALITVADYNSLQSSVALILGKGNTTYGYGQAILSQQKALPSIIGEPEWTKLRNDIISCFLYQNGGNASSLTTLLPVITKNMLVTTAIFNKYQDTIDGIIANRNPILVPSTPVNQGTTNGLTSGTYTNWNNIITEIVTVTFVFGSKPAGTSSYGYTADDAARFYFNSGSVIELLASNTGASGTLKDQSWIDMFAAMGTIRFGLSTTSRTGSSTNSILTDIGYIDLSTSFQVIFTEYAAAGVYSANYYQILARKTSVAGQLEFKIRFNDATPSLDPLNEPDDLVTGVTTSTIQSLHASGYVSLPAPSGVKTSSVITNSPTYRLTASPSAVQQGSRQIFTIVTTNVANLPATTLYWTAAIASTKLQGGVIQGTAVVSNNTATFYVDTVLDFCLIPTPYYMNIRVGSYSGIIVAQVLATIALYVPTYAITINAPTTINEGQSVSVSVNTTGVPDGTIMYWSALGTGIDGNDFTIGVTSGSLQINSNTFNSSLSLTNDNHYEGVESFVIQISTTDNVLRATSNPATVNDTSFINASVSPGSSSVKMGQYVTFYVTTEGIANGTTLAWALGGTAAASRFTNGIYGTVVVSGSMSSATGSFNVWIVSDSAPHSSDVFYAQLYTAGYVSALGGPSTNVTISVSGTLYYGASASFTVPAGVKQLIVNGIGGGGASTGFHVNKGYYAVSLSGGPGGGILNYTTTVNTGDVCAVTVGSGGGPGCYRKGGWCTGGGGTPTVFAINGVQCFSANPGGSGYQDHVGSPGGGVINVPGTGGSVVSGGTGGACAMAYSIWSCIGSTNPDLAGIPPIVCPTQIANAWVRGRAEQAGWLSISYS